MLAEGCSDAGLVLVSDHEDLSLEVRHLSSRLNALTQDLGTVEARQVGLDRRLVELKGLVQGMQEEQYSHTCAVERSQKTLACGAQRALNTAVAVQKHVEQKEEWQTCMDKMTNGMADCLVNQLEQRWEARLEEHTRWLMDLQSDVAAMSLEAPATNADAKADEERGGANEPVEERPSPLEPLGERISALERAQRTVSLSARRALHTAIIVHQQQQTQEQEEDRGKEKAVEDAPPKPFSELEQHCSQRFTEQDERMDKILQMVDTLADRVLQQQALPDEASSEAGAGHQAGEPPNCVHELREKVEELEANVYGLAAQLQAQHGQHSAAGGFGLADGGVSRDSFVAAMESLEARVDRSLSEVDRSLEDVCQRLDSLQDQQRLALRQLSNELPEVSQKLDQLWSQCQYYFPRVKEHDVHFSFFRTSFENHKQQMLDFADGLERNRLTNRNSQSAGNHSSGAETARAPCQGLGLGSAGFGSGLGASSGLSTNSGAGPTASGPTSGSGSSVPGSCTATSAADEGPRARMLAQVMARLYADEDVPGTRPAPSSLVR